MVGHLGCGINASSRIARIKFCSILNNCHIEVYGHISTHPSRRGPRHRRNLIRYSLAYDSRRGMASSVALSRNWQLYVFAGDVLDTSPPLSAPFPTSSTTCCSSATRARRYACPQDACAPIVKRFINYEPFVNLTTDEIGEIGVGVGFQDKRGEKNSGATSLPEP
jgi:hypothetical protein